MLAKELEMHSKELITFLRTQGHPVRSHMSTIEDVVANIVRERLKKKPPAKPAESDAKTAAKPVSTDKAAAGSTERPRAARPAGPGRPAPQWGTDATSGSTAAGSKDRPKSPGGGAKRKRYFPTRDDLMDSGPRFVGTRRKFGGPGRGRRGGRDAGVAVTERPDKVEVALPITLKDLSAALATKANMLIKTLMQHGTVATINQFLDQDQIDVIALEFEVEITTKKKTDDAEALVQKLEDYKSEEGQMLPRAPVVTLLGHVDHGKTSILDWIRKSKLTKGEAGGITQHLGAYRVDSDPVHVVFIDTPGHQAFTEMRARGANATDVAVIVVAVDDGVMPQTEEAINHAKAAGVPIVVALNKIDKPDGNAARTKQQLSELALQPVEWGGDTEFVEVSATTGQGMDALLETLSLTAEIHEFKADPTRPAKGIVLEAENTTSQGVVATILVQDGTLRKGDHVLAGPAHGRVRRLLLNGIEPVSEAPPSTPVKITGLSVAPEAGDRLYVVGASDARSIAGARSRSQRDNERAERQQVTLENLFDQLEEGTIEEVRVILKADAKGSVDALRQALEKLSTSEVKVRILHAGVGAVSQDDVALADASEAVVIGFHVSTDTRARSLAQERGIEVRFYDIIYKAIDDVREAMASRLTPDREEKVKSHAEVRQVYRASKIGAIAGSYVTDGVMGRNDFVRLYRDGKLVHSGNLGSLKRFKDDAKEVKEGFECGIKISSFDDIKEGDIIESYVIVETPRTL